MGTLFHIFHRVFHTAGGKVCGNCAKVKNTVCISHCRFRQVGLHKFHSIFGVLLTMYDGRTNFSNQVAQEVRRHFPGKVYANAIPRNVRLAEAPSHGLPVIAYDRSSRGAAAYLAVAEEIRRKDGSL